MSGKLFGLGVGPGDAELLTLKALRLIKESEVIAVPGNDTENSVAYQIAKSVYGGLDEKILLPVAMPMTKDAAVLEENHKKAADDVDVHLKGTAGSFSYAGGSDGVFHVSVCPSKDSGKRI